MENKLLLRESLDHFGIQMSGKAEFEPKTLIKLEEICVISSKHSSPMVHIFVILNSIVK